MRSTVIASCIVLSLLGCGGDPNQDEQGNTELETGDGDSTGDGDGDGDSGNAACCYCYGYGVDAVDGDPANGDNIKDGTYGCFASNSGEAACLDRANSAPAIEHGHIWGWDPDCPEGRNEDPFDDHACDMECPAIDPLGQAVWCIQNSDDPNSCQAVWGGCNSTTTNPCAAGYEGWAACVNPWSGACLPDTPMYGGPGCNPANGWVDACSVDPGNWDGVGDEEPSVPAGWCCRCSDFGSCVPADECPGVDPDEVFCPVTGNPIEDKMNCLSAMCS